MIVRKTNLPEMPQYCLQRHHCLREKGKCSIGCSWKDREPRAGLRQLMPGRIAYIQLFKSSDA